MQPVALREIFRFYLPLVLTSQMMTLSGPLINVAVGRSTDPKLEFAGYWIGFSILMFVESPCFVVQQVAATLLSGYRSYRRLIFVSLLVGGAATATNILFALTPAGNPIFDYLIKTTPRAEALAREVLLLLSPIPILISIRGVANAIALREKRTDLIAQATGSRLFVLAGIVAVAVAVHTSSGALAGAAALVLGLVTELVLILHRTRTFRRKMRIDQGGPEDAVLRYGEIFRVAWPIAISAYVWTSIRPVINAILGRLPDPELAQGGFGVVLPLLLLTCSPLWALQNVTLILPESRVDLRRILRFSMWATVFFAIFVVVITWTPLRWIILRSFFSLSDEMERFVIPALLLLVLEPLFLATRSTSQGLLIKARRTAIFTSVSLMKIGVLAATGFALVRRYPDMNGVFLGTALFISGEMIDGVFYSLKARSLVLGGVLFPTLTGRE